MIHTRAWGNHHAWATLAATTISVALGTATPLVLVTAASFAMLWCRNWPELARVRPFGGYANYVTSARLLLILGIAFAMIEVSRSWVMLAFAVNVGMDVADGYLARRNSQTTQFGATFDREVDAVFVLVACLYFYLTQGIAGWILLPGLLPYVYRLVVWRVGDGSAAEVKQRVAAWLAGVNYVLLLIGVAAPTEPQLYVLIVSTCLVTSSFLMSSWIFYRNAGSIS